MDKFKLTQLSTNDKLYRVCRLDDHDSYNGIGYYYIDLKALSISCNTEDLKQLLKYIDKWTPGE